MFVGFGGVGPSVRAFLVRASERLNRKDSVPVSMM
jgi:hypothetical protein